MVRLRSRARVLEGLVAEASKSVALHKDLHVAFKDLAARLSLFPVCQHSTRCKAIIEYRFVVTAVCHIRAGAGGHRDGGRAAGILAVPGPFCIPACYYYYFYFYYYFYYYYYCYYYFYNDCSFMPLSCREFRATERAAGRGLRAHHPRAPQRPRAGCQGRRAAHAAAAQLHPQLLPCVQRAAVRGVVRVVPDVLPGSHHMIDRSHAVLDSCAAVLHRVDGGAAWLRGHGSGAPVLA